MKKLEKLFIKESTTIKEAMKAITEAARYRLPVGIALVADDKGALLGTVTDGDIRKALVNGSSTESRVEEIMAKNPITVDEDLEVDEMLTAMAQKVKESGRIDDNKVDKVIVTNKDNRVVDVIDFYDLWNRQETRYKDVCVVGVGHVGLTLSVVLSELGYQTTGFDINEDLINQLSKGEIGFYEKGVKPLLNFHLKEKNIAFTTALSKNLADIYVICVGTPIDEKANQPNNDAIKKAAAAIGKILKKDDVVLLRSTVAVGTTRNTVLPILEEQSSLKAGKDFYLAFAPERVVEGNALAEIREIPQIVGGINKKSAQEATNLLQKISPSVVLLDSLEEAEMVKLINNTYRDHSFAFANKMALLCSHLNLDAVKIIKASSEGYPRNPVPLPSPGVGGYCLTKDPYLMADAAKGSDIDPELFFQSRKINMAMPRFVASKILRFINNEYKSESDIKIFLLGFAFKGFPETSDMRGSPTLDVLEILQNDLKGRIKVFGFDSVIEAKRINGLNVEYAPYKDGFRDAHCTLIMNNHPDFSKMDIFTLLEMMKRPGLLFDGWHLFNRQEIERIKGIQYQGLGGF